jgi:hypothetical protein
MVGGMATTKTSVSLTHQAIAAAGDAAKRRGMSVSAWLSEAAIHQAWREQALQAADELLEEAIRHNGELTAEDQQWIANVLAQTTGESERADAA